MIHNGMTYGDYEDLPGWRWSHIRLMHDRSPRHVKHALTEPDDDTASRRWLRAIHSLVVEPSNFERDFSVFYGRRAGKEYNLHVDRNEGKSILNEREHREAVEAANAIRSHPDVAKFLGAGAPEVVLTWDDAATGLPCKARLDWLSPTCLVDIKTLGTTHEGEVARLIEKRLYHGQLAHYAAGLRAHNIDVPAFIVAAEGKGAQDVAVFRLDDRPPDGPLHIGAQLRADLMQRLAECVATDHWPGRHDGVHDIAMRESEGPDPDDVMTFGKGGTR
jgi:hypothetical protein